MLLEFTVGNFLSFKEKKTLSLEATNIKELPENIIERDGYKVLNSAVIYGANSSGKSNLLKAFAFMRTTILNSSKLNSVDELGVIPFLLNTETEKKPSFFELLILIEGKRLRYGFEIDNVSIHTEWLFILSKDSKKEQLLFVRDKNGIAVDGFFSKAEELIEKTRDNALFLSVCDTWGIGLAQSIMKYFDYTSVLSGIKHEREYTMTLMMLRKEALGKKIKEFLVKFKLGFNDICNYDDDKKLTEKVTTIHNKYDKDGQIVGVQEFKIMESESAGTNKVFDIIGFILFSLVSGHPLIIDELDAKLHPLLTIEIIRMFNSKETNPDDAQLIFATHDTNLLSSKLFRRDQIWFTEKDEVEATDLYSLVEFKDENNQKVRKDRSFESDYIKGRYGAIPYIH